MTSPGPEYVLKAHAIDDVEQIRGQMIRGLTTILPLAQDGYHAATHGSPEVAAEFLDRIDQAATTMLVQLRERTNRDA